MAKGLFGKKGGSSAARAARARKGHTRRHARHLGAGSSATHYKGAARRRTRNGWFGTLWIARWKRAGPLLIIWPVVWIAVTVAFIVPWMHPVMGW